MFIWAPPQLACVSVPEDAPVLLELWPHGAGLYVPGQEPILLHKNAQYHSWLFTLAARHPIYTLDAARTWTAALRSGGQPFQYQAAPRIVQDLVLANSFRDDPVPIPETPLETWEREAPRLAAQLEVARQRMALTAPTLYPLDLQLARAFAHHSAVGYRGPQGLVHPTWHLAHDSQSARISSGQPPIQSTRKVDRHLYPAEPFHRWYEVAWIDPEITVLAICTGDTLFQRWQLDDFVQLWGTTDDQARLWLREALRGAWDDPESPEQALAMHQLYEMAPGWVEWSTRQREEAVAHGRIASFMGRQVPCPIPHRAPILDAQTTESLCLKLVIAQLDAHLDDRRDVLTGFSRLIPIYTKLYYQVDEHVPVARHAEFAARVASLEPRPGIHFRVAVAAGPTWGTLQPVNHAFAQAQAELLQPAHYALVCPCCESRAPNEPTLREHILDDHPDALLLGERAQVDVLNDLIAAAHHWTPTEEA